jgi:glycosyltransferase involved in cell wall biosynthesis
MGALKVLITNNSLRGRTGSELYARDIALGLLARGHTPIVYTPRAGELARELRRETVPVVEDLAQVGAPPDLIHGQHHAETMTALLYFRETPAIFFCHGWLPWDEMPPRFPRVLRYVAVDETCRDRLLWEHAVPAERVHVVLNFVDLERFRPRPPLPDAPRRALLFSNYAGEATHLGAVREACARAGLKLDVVGQGVGRVAREPEKLLGGYDLVFAKARCALEALAVGAAVVLCDAAGLGPLVTAAELERLRRLNFGVRALSGELRPEDIAAQIARYNARDAAEVSRQIRATAGRGAAVDEIIALYREVVAEHRARPRDEAAEWRAAADYLRALLADVRDQREQLERKEEAIANSTAVRLRRRFFSVPLLGPLARAAARRLAR